MTASAISSTNTTAQLRLMSDLKSINNKPPENYPEKPPRVPFTSEMFHPNVYHDGSLCMDIIQDAWSSCHNVSTILTSIWSLLSDPNPSSPANPEAAHLYQHDIQAYNKRLRCCARRSIESS